MPGYNGVKMVDHIELVERKSIMHYAPHKSKFIKIYTVLPRHVNACRSFVEKGIVFNGSTFFSTTYESNISHPLRFMIDNNISGMNWADIMPGAYTVRPRSLKKTSA